MIDLIRRLLIFAIPFRLWVVVWCTMGLFGVVVVLVLVVGGATSAIASDLHYQCDSAVGPDPSQTVTPSRASATSRPTTRSTPSAGVSTAPTTNPFAELTIAPDDTSASDWQRACATALKDAPYQSAPLLTGNSGIGAACARELALAQLAASSSSGVQNDTGGRADAAEFTRSVIYRASAAQSTGRCERNAGAAAQPPAADIARQPNGSARRACGQPDGSGAAVVVLPNTVAAQGACGQRVDPSAVSAGDLVFWNYRKNGPTQVGIAVSAGQLVTADTAGGFVELAIPSTNDVRVKRVLGSGM
ncbi:NlpC/P60 family protein [Nocardia sp. NPDC051787]|uniref:NlpC/P60 family protein n=1 Tax=Nocardia sp. NPDC051787 TaxID=3155415 RepID=UPI00341E99CA